MGHVDRDKVHVVGRLQESRADTSFVDPTLELDLYADKPWALSPALSTMNHLGLAQTGSSPMPEPGGSPAFVDEDALGVVPGQEEHAAEVAKRRKHFGGAEQRAAVSLGDKHVALEFGNGILGAWAEGTR